MATANRISGKSAILKDEDVLFSVSYLTLRTGFRCGRRSLAVENQALDFPVTAPGSQVRSTVQLRLAPQIKMQSLAGGAVVGRVKFNRGMSELSLSSGHSWGHRVSGGPKPFAVSFLRLHPRPIKSAQRFW